MQSPLNVILLIGAPGSGKSLLGSQLAAASNRKNTSETKQFFSVGNRLRELGMLDDDQNQTIDRQKIEEMAKTLLETEIQYHLTEPRSVHTLILECVKSVSDAFSVMETLKTHGAMLKHVLYISSPGVGCVLRKNAGYSSRVSALRDADRLVYERQEKWSRNMRGLLEFFSSTRVMLEVSRKTNGPGVLAVLGYGKELNPQEQTEKKDIIDPPTGLLFTAIEPVVSDRLVVDQKVMHSVLREAEQTTGLRLFLSPAKLPVPSKPVLTANDAGWVGWPERYCVSAKCDGTRHILIVGEADGVARMHTRAGSMYEYPVSTKLKNGTVLDGELVWMGGQGFFVAFDVISIGGNSQRLRQAWQLPLMDRLSLLRKTHPWIPEAGECDAMIRCAAQFKDEDSCERAQKAWEAAQANWEQFIAEKTAIEYERRKKGKSLQFCEFRSRRGAVREYLEPSVDEWVKTYNYLNWRKEELDNYVHRKQHHLPEMNQLYKKQQAPPNATVTVVWKRHYPVTVEAMSDAKLTGECPYPTDGLVFTPRETPYALGMSELLRKWQPRNLVKGDIVQLSDNFANCIDPMELLEGLVYECRLRHEQEVEVRELFNVAKHFSWRGRVNRQNLAWIPLSIRWDKTRGNDEETIDNLSRENAISFEDLVQEIATAQKQHASWHKASQRSSPCHPVRTMIAELGSEAALLDKIMREAVATGEVEHTVDKETGLDIFNHFPLHGRPATPLQNVCRGLIACLRTAEVVATPFPRFRDQLFVGDRQNEIARAAFKIDGSLAIVFLWNGELHVSTRRRMDSQQALWTKTWLRAHTDMGEYELGWTYLFEAVFQDNRVVVPYPFDAPVLLAAVSPSGERASHAECVNMAYRMGVMLAPSVVGQLKEIESNLASIMCKDHLPPTHEGWIVTTSNGTNTKLVLPAYMRASAEASRLHPLEVWDRVRTGGESRSGMLHLKGLAEHHSQELSRILDALQAAYSKAHDGAGPACMHYSRFDEDHGHTRARLLDSIRPGFMHSFRFDEDHRHTRALLLDSIKPGFDGTLEGYEPAGFMVNTFAKGWAQGVIKTGRFSQEPLIQSKLSDPSILGLVLESLDGHDMGRAMLVNRKWSLIIRSAPGFEAKVEEVPIKGINWNRRSSNPYSSSDDERGGWGGAGYSHGYGSD